MAQRRMSRKSFRKSRGRKTRSMRRHTMGGNDYGPRDDTADGGVMENVGEILSKINTRLEQNINIEDEKLRNEIKKLSETGKASCRGNILGLKSVSNRGEFVSCEKTKATSYYEVGLALFTLKDNSLYTNKEELIDTILKFFVKAFDHFVKFRTNDIGKDKITVDGMITTGYNLASTTIQKLKTILKDEHLNKIRELSYTSEGQFNKKIMLEFIKSHILGATGEVREPEEEVRGTDGGRKTRRRKNKKSKRSMRMRYGWAGGKRLVLHELGSWF